MVRTLTERKQSAAFKGCRGGPLTPTHHRRVRRPLKEQQLSLAASQGVPQVYPSFEERHADPRSRRVAQLLIEHSRQLEAYYVFELQPGWRGL